MVGAWTFWLGCSALYDIQCPTRMLSATQKRFKGDEKPQGGDAWPGWVGRLGSVERLERLVNLVAALLDARQPLTREELRVRVGGYSEDDDSFRRNFERDKELLRQMGMPLVLEPLDRGRPEGRRDIGSPGTATSSLTRSWRTTSWRRCIWPPRRSTWKVPGGAARPPGLCGSWPRRIAHLHGAVRMPAPPRRYPGRGRGSSWR